MRDLTFSSHFWNRIEFVTGPVPCWRRKIVLEELIEEWLNATHSLALHFPPGLEQRFEADTGPERCRNLAVFNAIGFLLGCALYPVIVSAMPDAEETARRLYLFGAMPLGFVISGALWLQPPAPLREALVLLGNTVCISVSASLLAVSVHADLPVMAGGVACLMVYSAIGIQLRFGYALTAVVAVAVAYGLALHHKTEIGPAAQREMLVLALVTGAFVMLANWRLERAARRSYLLILRESFRGRDLSRRNDELGELARRDPLTGLANRRAYDAWLAEAWAQAAPGAGRVGLIVLDIDRFKAFNDFYGHAAGDDCLKTIALCLREQLRGMSDQVARLGGEEFAVLLPGLSAAICADVAERMRLAVQRLELPHLGLGPHGMVSISAGAASHPAQGGMATAHLFEAADAALYEAKMSGRNRVCIATLACQAEAAPAET